MHRSTWIVTELGLDFLEHIEFQSIDGGLMLQLC